MNEYHITEIGTLSGGSYSYGTAINNRGQAVGGGNTVLKSGQAPVEHALYQDPAGARTDLHLLAPAAFEGPNSSALDINEAGEVVGWAQIADGLRRGFLWSGGKMQVLPPPFEYGGPGQYDMTPHAINKSGAVVGVCTERKQAIGIEGHAFLWNENWLPNLVIDLNPPGFPFSVAEDVSDSLRIVGFAAVPGDRAIPSPFEWLPTRDLNPGASQPAAAAAISNNGLIVGDMNADKGDEAMYIQPFFPPIPLYLAGPLGPISEAFDVNDSWQIVGQAQFTAGGPFHAFLWQGAGLIDLNTQIDDSANWELLSAVGISQDGYFIVGNGTYKGQQRGFILNRKLAVPNIPRVNPIAILAGGRLDTTGIGLREGHVVPIPPGPDAYQHAVLEIMKSLAALQLGFHISDKNARHGIQQKALDALKKTIGLLTESTK